MKTCLALIPMVFALTALGDRSPDDGQPLEILAASYGFEDQRVEVAEVLRPHIRHGMFYLPAPWGLGNPDPKPGVVKDVEIRYRQSGAMHTAVFHQREDVLLPPPSEMLSIISASYGIGSSRVDATEAVRAAVKNDRIQLPGRWGLGRVDPAAGKIKNVEITYVYDGAVRTAKFSQNEVLQLP